MAVHDVGLAGLPRGSTLAERVHILRPRRAWSRQDLAQRAGGALSAVEGLERGKACIATLSAVLAMFAPAARALKLGQGAFHEAGKKIFAAIGVPFQLSARLPTFTGSLRPSQVQIPSSTNASRFLPIRIETKSHSASNPGIVKPNDVKRRSSALFCSNI